MSVQPDSFDPAAAAAILAAPLEVMFSPQQREILIEGGVYCLGDLLRIALSAAAHQLPHGGYSKSTGSSILDLISLRGRNGPLEAIEAAKLQTGVVRPLQHSLVATVRCVGCGKKHTFFATRPRARCGACFAGSLKHAPYGQEKSIPDRQLPMEVADEQYHGLPEPEGPGLDLS